MKSKRRLIYRESAPVPVAIIVEVPWSSGRGQIPPPVIAFIDTQQPGIRRERRFLYTGEEEGE